MKNDATDLIEVFLPEGFFLGLRELIIADSFSPGHHLGLGEAPRHVRGEQVNHLLPLQPRCLVAAHPHAIVSTVTVRFLK